VAPSPPASLPTAVRPPAQGSSQEQPSQSGDAAGKRTEPHNGAYNIHKHIERKIRLSQRET